MFKKHILILGFLIIMITTILFLSRNVPSSDNSVSITDLKNYYSKGDYDLVIENSGGCMNDSFDKLERLDCYRYLWSSYIEKGEYLKAAEICQDSLKINLDVNDVRFCAALIEKAEGQYRTIEFWKKYLKNFPKTGEIDVAGLRAVEGTGKLYYPWFRK